MVTLFTPSDGIQQLRHLDPELLRLKLSEAVESYLVGLVKAIWVAPDTGEPEHTTEDLQGEEAVLAGAVPAD